METYENEIFISYAWGEEREEIVNQIDKSLQERGYKVVRDKRDLGYKGFIRQFMERIGRGNCVIVVVSDKYLKSDNCMYELVEIAENKQFADRIFPVVLSDAEIYDPAKRIEYVRYWEAKKVELNEKMMSLSDLANLKGITEELDNYDRFRDEISGLVSTLKDMNTLTPQMHRDSNFTALFEAIEKRMKEGGQGKPQPEQVQKEGKTSGQDEQDRGSAVVIGHVQGHVIDRPSGPIHIGDNVAGPKIGKQKIVEGDEIHVGDISNSTGVAIGQGAQAQVQQQSGMSADEIVKIFSMLQQHVAKMPPGDEKDETKGALEKLQKEAQKGEAADETRVQKYIKFLAETAPDIWEVAVDTFLNPVKGLSTVFRKVAERARENRK
ncbi:MAG: toll/interleukin-1 receptor domain-containing protein [Chloroflexota bacterium]